MAWSEADQNPNTRPPSGYGMPTYADTLNSYAYGGMGGGSSFTPSSTTTTTSGQRNYAQELGSTANQSRKASTTSRALQQSATRTQPRSATAADGSGYVVQRGDNLTKIGQRFGMSPTEIARANNIRNPNRISAGQRLTIPGGRSAVIDGRPYREEDSQAGRYGGPMPSDARRLAPGTAPATDQAPAMGGGYVVKRGDNLTRIAQQYGVSVQDIAQANGIRNPNRLSPGQRLNIPGAAARPEVNMPTPRMRPQQWNMQPDPGRFEDAIGGPQRPPARTVPQDAPRLNIDGALANIDSERNALNAADRRRMMESEAPQPAYRAPPRQANNVDMMTQVDASGNYVLPQNVGGARPEGPAGGMPAARYQPMVAGRQEVPGSLPAARPDPAQQMATLPDRMQYDDLSQSMALARARADANYYRNQQNIMQAPPQGQQPRPAQQARPAGNESTTGTWSDLPDPTPPGYGAPATDPLAGRFEDGFAAAGGGTIMDLRPAFESRAPTNVPPGPPVFVTPSGVRVWAAR